MTGRADKRTAAFMTMAEGKGEQGCVGEDFFRVGCGLLAVPLGGAGVESGAWPVEGRVVLTY